MQREPNVMTKASVPPLPFSTSYYIVGRRKLQYGADMSNERGGDGYQLDEKLANGSKKKAGRSGHRHKQATNNPYNTPARLTNIPRRCQMPPCSSRRYPNWPPCY